MISCHEPRNTDNAELHKLPILSSIFGNKRDFLAIDFVFDLNSAFSQITPVFYIFSPKKTLLDLRCPKMNSVPLRSLQVQFS